jgi:hypothetical protein
MAALTNANEEEKEEAKVSEVIVVQEETDTNDKEYPTSPKWDDQDPDNVQHEPPVDAMFCGFCLITPCLFMQEDILRSEAHMDPGKTNRVKQFNFYQTMTRELYGHLGKGVHGICTPMTRLRGPTQDSSKHVKKRRWVRYCLDKICR